MHRALTVTEPPAVEPVTVAQAQEWVRQDAAFDATLLGGVIKAARLEAERRTGRAFITRTLAYTLDRFPSCEKGDPWFDGTTIFLPRPRLQAVTEIVYTDADGGSSTVPAADYQIDTHSEPGRLALAPGKFWPATGQGLNAVQITYITGYGDAAPDVPDDVTMALRMMVNQWYGRPETSDGDWPPIPAAALALLQGVSVGEYP